MLKLSIKADVAKLQRQLDNLANKQMPFATASALTALAKRVQSAETAALAETLDRPSPFTKRSVGVKAATKATLTALVFVKDIAAAYLEPFEFGGPHFLGSKRALLVPKNQPVNQYGNLPRGAMARLKGRPDVFIGKVHLKSGQVVSGVWQRQGGGRGARLRSVSAKPKSGLKLLIRFEAPLPVTQHLGYRDRARKIIATEAAAELRKAFAKAFATARR